ncbi:putative sodium/potassium/calcium exchanger [Fulvivirga sediminis]|uniref:Outer membrane protein beta-barrel domain-containing protein n=1 Tax=Fulvivirga sediminis TaxID=2803949 RepID=A0A937FB58_9BACT|nr:hypothetical protein [Fulvivirga sediminis]MBL3658726.1 hypothetical protein [Fulvivirga sediminis]
MSQSREEDKFGGHFRDRFESWEDAPPADGWQKLNKSLDAEDNSRKKWYALSVVALLLLIGGGYYLLDSNFINIGGGATTTVMSNSNNDLLLEDVSNTSVSSDQADGDMPSSDCASEENDFANDNISLQTQNEGNESPESDGTVGDIPGNDKGKAAQPPSAEVNESSIFLSNSSNDDKNSKGEKRSKSGINNTKAKSERYTLNAQKTVRGDAYAGNEKIFSEKSETSSEKKTSSEEELVPELVNDASKSDGRRNTAAYFDSNKTSSSAEAGASELKSSKTGNNDSSTSGLEKEDKNSPIISYEENSGIASDDNHNKNSKEEQTIEKSSPLSIPDSLESEKTEELKKEKLKDEELKQEKEEQNKELKHSKWSLLLGADVNYSFKHIIPQNDLLYISSVDNMNELSLKNAGYEISLSARYKLTDRTSISGTVSWLNTRDNTSYTYTPLVADSVEVINVSPDSFDVNTFMNVSHNEVQNSTNYVGLSVGFLHKVRLLSVERSLFADFRLMKVVSSKTDLNKSGHLFDRNSTIGSVQVGVENPINIHRFQMIISPYFELPFSSLYSSKSVYQMKGSRVGVSLGIPLNIGH